MPELPEVEVVRRGLAAHVLGRQVRTVEVRHPRAVRRQPEGPGHFVSVLTGRTLTGTGRRGKFLWLATDDPDLVLAAHLGMSGQFRVDSASGGPGLDLGGEPDLEQGERGRPDPGKGEGGEHGSGQRDGGTTAPHRHARAHFDLGERQLWFLDQRTFGWLAACPVVADPRGEPVPDLVRDIAPDPTDPAFDVRAVARAMRTHRVEVKRLLLAQTLVSGIGNIYADESLWAAGVHPRRRADRLGVATLVRVLDEATAVMAASLAQGGTSFDSLYVNVNGESGYYSRGLAVYGRAGMPCPRCGTAIVRERFMNRSSHVCPRCQRPPRLSH
jgi:formamidopyrimidine-DNA glycosylase